MASNVYKAKCAFRPSDGGLTVAPAIITRSTPSSPCASVRGRVIVESASPPPSPSSLQAAVQCNPTAKKPLPSSCRHLPLPSDKLEKASSEPSLKKASAAKRTEGGGGSANNRKSTPLDTLLSFEEGDLFEVLSKDGRIWWACRALGPSDAVGYVPASYLQPAPAEDSDVKKTEEVGGGQRKSWWSPEGDSKEGDPESIHLRALKELRVRVGELHPDFLYPTMIPEPDYCDNSSQQQENNRRNIAQQQGGGVHLGITKGSNRNKGGSSALTMDQEGLILPRKPQNPCLDSVDRQNLHRELLFNQKIGKSVLNQKSELQRAMERQREQQARREQEQQRISSRTPFQRVIEERAKKLEETLEKEDDKANLPEPEFIKVHAKLRARMDSK
ncbi:uncharacterized protein [Hetaerina americana]|uniref:uncharacterized protein isoform X1 n=1 Tax=Hetaerina americana TaxID=62018 RepID=UPI003A7F27F6